MTDTRDRLTRAWELRRDVHAWLKINLGSELHALFAAFDSVSKETLRQVVKKLCKDLDAVMVRAPGNVCRYSAVTLEIRPLEETRARLRECGRRNVGTALAGYKAAHGKPAKAAAAKPAASTPPRYPGPQIDPERPWRTTHTEGSTAPAPDSRGQGAAREKVSVNCFQLY